MAEYQTGIPNICFFSVKMKVKKQAEIRARESYGSAIWVANISSEKSSEGDSFLIWPVICVRPESVSHCPDYSFLQ